MSKPIVGMAIQITEDNVDKIAVVNNGLAPAHEGFYTGSFFVYPYDVSIRPKIVVGYVFAENWEAAYPGFELNDKFFVDIIEK